MYVQRKKKFKKISPLNTFLTKKEAFATGLGSCKIGGLVNNKYRHVKTPPARGGAAAAGRTAAYSRGLGCVCARVVWGATEWVLT
jgi:hypothetical protein